MLIKEAVEQYVKELQKDNDTIKAYRLDLERFIENFGTKKATSIVKEEVRNYLDNLTTRRGGRVSVSTQNRHYATLSCFFNWLIDRGVIKENPMKSISRRKPNKDAGEINPRDIIRHLDKDIVEDIIEQSLSIREEFLFHLLYHSGMRISEALSLNVEDISKGIIHIRQGKGNRARITYLSKESEKLYKRYLEKRIADRSALSKAKTPEEREKLKFSGALFTTNNGNRLGYHRANQLFKQSSRKFKNPDGSVLTLHQLRHTFCTERAGYMDSVVLQKIAGHSDIRTTLRYLKVADTVAEKQFRDFEDEMARIREQEGLAV